MTLRPEAEILDIRQHLDELRQAAWLGPARQWWPACLFHCTDILNVASILEQGELLSRVQAEKTGRLQVDIASPEVIAGTHSQWQDYVRLYFRPRTPTQYRNEGFCPLNQWSWNSHCPVPVYFIFNAVAVLSHADCRFSDGNLGSDYANVESSVSFLKQIPFNVVYHDTWFNPLERDQIVHHRNAEVLVPQRMGLESLLSIGCRSDAEYKTLLHLLPSGVHSRWVDKVGVRTKLHLFNRKWTFVEQAEMNSERIIFRFNRNSSTPGPFDARVELTDPETGQRYHWHDGEYQAKNTLTLQLHQLRNPFDYTVRLFLDDQLAYANRYQADDLPF